MKWLKSEKRKPLVIRGARQVGKTWLVRHLAKISGLELIELNFEKNKAYIDFFASNDPAIIMRHIMSALRNSTNLEKCLLLLDEIQAVPEILSKLRWFAEDMPNLPVIATGSLLDFALEKFEFSMPVGRISYLYLEPFSFEEFLLALDYEGLLNYLHNYQFNVDMPKVLHNQLITLFKEYLLVGGLPAAVDCWKRQQSLQELNIIHNELISTYQDDFNKYRGRVPVERLHEVMISVPKQLSKKFVYSHASQDVPSSQIKPALTLLNKARVCHQVISCHANGLPLAAETNDKYFKELFLDVGLCSAHLGLSLHELHSVTEINLINKGGVAEQAVGQILRTTFPYYIDPALYCWMRQETEASSELDYIFQHKNRIIPLEVKAGTTGSLKSLHYFMGIKNYDLEKRPQRAWITPGGCSGIGS
jgi:hypothetical protein